MASVASSPRRPSASARSESSQSDSRRVVSTTQSRNPVSQRLSKVLGTNFDNEDTRQALRTLSDLYAIPRGKEVHVVVDDGDDELGQESTETPLPAPTMVLVESVPGESAARARKNLRRDMETQLAEGSRKFLQALGEVDAVRMILTSSRVCIFSSIWSCRNYVNCRSTSQR